MSHANAEPVAFASPDADVLARLEDYGRTQSPLALRQAADAAAAHDGEAPADTALALTLARQRVAGWLAILEIIHADLDPAFDPENPPTTTVSPPPDASGMQLFAGVSPNALTDMDQRRAYLTLIEENDIRLADFGRMSKLFSARKLVLERAKPSILDASTTLGVPVSEISALLELAQISDADRTALG